MSGVTRSLLGSAIVAGAVAVAAFGGRSSRDLHSAPGCTYDPYSALPDPSITYMLAMMLPDTAVVPGALPATDEHPNRSAIGGQLATVIKAGSHGDDSTRLPTAGERVVLVPGRVCDHGWRESIRWTEPGITGVIWGWLAEEWEWVEGLRTYRIRAPSYLPHPMNPPYWFGTGIERRASAEAFYTLLDSLPTAQQRDAKDAEAGERIIAWHRNHKDIELYFPVNYLLWGVYGGYLRELRPSALPRSPDLSGTYAITISQPRQPPVDMIIRTRAEPGGVWPMHPRMAPPTPPVTDWVEGHRYEFIRVPSDSIPAELRWGTAEDRADHVAEGVGRGELPWQDYCRGELVVSAHVEPADDDGVVRVRGEIGHSDLYQCIAMSSALQRQTDAYYAIYPSYYSPAHPNGVLTVHADGSVTLEQKIAFAERYFGDYRDDTIRITGERISTTTFHYARD